MRAASGMNRSIDPRRPRSLSDRQLAEVKRHLEVKLLLRTRNALAKQIRGEYGTISRTKGTEIHELYARAYRRPQSRKKAVQKAFMTEVEAGYRKRQALTDIENQLNGPLIKAEEDATTDHGFNDRFSKEHRRAIAALFNFATSEPAEECNRRSQAVSAVSTLSKRQELRDRKICRSRSLEMGKITERWT